MEEMEEGNQGCVWRTASGARIARWLMIPQSRTGVILLLFPALLQGYQGAQSDEGDCKEWIRWLFRKDVASAHMHRTMVR